MAADNLKKNYSGISKNIIFSFVYLLLYLPVFAQYTVRFEVYDPTHKDATFLAGSFNDWNPGDPKYKLRALDATHKYLTLKNITPGTYQFKFTRGDWTTVESTALNSNRTVMITTDTTLKLTIEGWGDDYLSDTMQLTVGFEVYDPTHKSVTFLAGSFNHWNPGDTRYNLTVLDSTHKFINLKNLTRGKYFFKFTRGDWSTVESTKYGFNIEDRIVEIKKDTILKLVIAGWLDDYLDLSRLPDIISLQKGLETSLAYLDRNLDSSYKYADYIYEHSKKIGNKKYEAESLNMLGRVFKNQGNSGKALELFLQALAIARSQNDSLNLSIVNRYIGNIFDSQSEHLKAKHYYLDAIKFTPADDNGLIIRGHVLFSLGEIYFKTSQLDSSQYYAHMSLGILNLNEAKILLGDIQKKLGNKDRAMQYYRESVSLGFAENKPLDIAKAYQRIAQEFIDNNQPDSGFYYSRKSFAIATDMKDPYRIAESGMLLVNLFKHEKRLDSAFIYQQIVLKINDSLFSRDKERQIHNMVFNEQLHQQEMIAERQKYRSRTWIYVLSAGFILLLLTAGLLTRNNRQKKQANRLLQGQKEQIQTTLTELKATQFQLIQSEKMASLGELTSGIAHEIKNPLNFINNFSEINIELIAALEEEQLAILHEKAKPDITPLIKTIKKNSEKINHHGKRVDEIVKGMLQHSRLENIHKEPVNINALCDESLKLAYHGFRAKEKTFNASFETRFDPDIPQIRVIPQDIGRVLLNLINNAFYTVTEKKKRNQPDSQDVLEAASLYKPSVIVSTKRSEDKILITVSDNGMGIPSQIINKIFQPFFTTKPTGEGTGLGLSMSYDIISKSHGGEIRAKSKEGIGTDFEIVLPI